MSLLFALPALMQVVVVIPPERVTTMDTSDGATWQIIDDDSEFAAADVELRRGATIVRQRLVPKYLAVVSGDVVRIDGGDRWADAGDQLFGARVGDMNAWCVLESKVNVTVGALFVPTRNRLIKIDCFIDSDNDGLLDQRFEADPGIGVLPNVARSEPQAFYDLQPVGFTAIDPVEFAEESWVELEFRGGGRRDDDPLRFRVSYRYDGSTRRMTGEHREVAAQFPHEVGILGSRVAINRDDNGDFSAQVLQPMQSSFGVVTTLEY